MRLAAVLALLTASPAGAADPIHADRQEIHYVVTGSTAREILDSLDRQRRNAGVNYYAEARWAVQWRYDYGSPTRNACAVRNPRIVLVELTTLPRWERPRAVSGALEAQWARFMENLRRHELGHLEHGRRAAAEILAMLQKSRGAGCDELGVKVNAAGDAIVKRYGDLDRRYDVETQHGRTQGAWWTVSGP